MKLNNGLDMPQVGFGLWKVENSVCADVVYNAIKAGYRLFDGACGECAVSNAKSHPPKTCLSAIYVPLPRSNGRVIIRDNIMVVCHKLPLTFLPQSNPQRLDSPLIQSSLWAIH